MLLCFKKILNIYDAEWYRQTKINPFSTEQGDHNCQCPTSEKLREKSRQTLQAVASSMILICANIKMLNDKVSWSSTNMFCEITKGSCRLNIG